MCKKIPFKTDTIMKEYLVCYDDKMQGVNFKV